MGRSMIAVSVAVALGLSGASHAQTVNPAPGATPPAAEKKRCRSQNVTGSLVRKVRICMTEREWARERDKAQSMNSLTCSDRTVCAGT